MSIFYIMANYGEFGAGGLAAVEAQVKLYVITSPVGPYYASGFKPVSLLASEKYPRGAREGARSECRIS